MAIIQGVPGGICQISWESSMG